MYRSGIRACLYCLAILIAGSLIASADEGQQARQMPMPINTKNAITYRWLNKPVLESRLLDDMEEPGNWSHHGFGEMGFTQERAKDGKQSVRLMCPTVSEKPGEVSGRPFGACSIRRNFPGEDWRDYNRLSFWVYPHLPGFKVISASVVLVNEGSVKSPGPHGRDGRNFFLLKADQWNHVVWEIAHIARDKVTCVEFSYRLQGSEPGATKTVVYDIDKLELEKVTADHFEGWEVEPGKIAFSHSGYATEGAKSAIACGSPARQFRLVEADTGETVLNKAVQNVKTRIGEFQVMDFSEVRREGAYRIEFGDIKTGPFLIEENPWLDSIRKTINLYYCERCGFAVPGIHDVCHKDWLCVHGDKRIAINGGWHDAGDLSQGLVNTSESAHAMLSLAETLQESDPALSRRLIEEARWGVEWILKTRFADGYRCTWATMGFWTDGKFGTVDDVTAEARNQPFENFLASSTEALAGRIFKDIDPNLASACLEAAKEDWRFARTESKSANLEPACAGAMAAIDLFKATADLSYGDAAVEFAEVIIASQQRSLTNWNVPLAGFFYTNPRKDRILHYSHRSGEQAPVVVLAELCAMFPDHADWMRWYSSVVLYSEYLKTISRFTEPYGMLPASVYRPDEESRPNFREQVLNGVEIGKDHYLRMFPVWYNGFRGNNGTLLSQAKALSSAAQLRGDSDLADLARLQLQWVVGRNPFSQSTMYGEGYDYAPQYTAMSGDMCGSLAVGIQSHFNADVPYWPADNCYNFKEVWVHPSARWLSVMCDLLGPLAACEPVEPDLLLSAETSPDGEVTIKLDARGQGPVSFAIRTANLKSEQNHLEAKLDSPDLQTLTWQGRMVSTNEPWVVVAVPDDDLSMRKEIFGWARN
ncbi:MAG: glycoside hydrolase family 9 protein [Sedimentisphaerales bacterium]|nr:glycoside hydrolase family 9 protein [Sedimentisphaerales bacterium]